MSVEVTTETVIDLPVARVCSVRCGPVERAELVREHQIGRVEDTASFASRVTGRVRRTFSRSHAPVHLRVRGTRAGREARDANRTGTVPYGDHLYVGTHVERLDTHDAPKQR